MLPTLHFLTKGGEYLCNGKSGIQKGSWTRLPKEVTCQDCKRMLLAKKAEGVAT